MNRRAVSLVMLALAACTNPDISKELELTNTHFNALKEGIETEITASAKEEHRRIETQTILAKEPVIGVAGDCDTIAARDEPKVLSDCRIVESFDAADDPGGATEVQTFLVIMDNYLAALGSLVNSKSSTEVQEQTNAIVAAFGSADANRPAAFEKLGQFARDRKQSFAKGSAFLVYQIRLSALRRALKSAAPLINKTVPLVASHLESFDKPLLAAQTELHDAQDDVNNALGTGNVKVSRAASDRLRKAVKAFKTAEAASPVIQLLLFKQAHLRLVEKATNGGSASDIIDLLEELKTLNTTINEET
ncbi:hypothetical protein RB2150_08769 [Rhodobacterales bacterium HTCC2150]|nr:hypothetical protein RB2150_08769 [Rhodobacterales bacterium HTCC2150] [Rhodobacteraceae bacterium HTCC2150]